MKKCFNKSLLAVSVVLGSSAALGLDPASVDLGGYEMIPTLSVSTGYDDNPFSQNDSLGPDGMMVTTVSPSVQFLAQQDDNVYSVNVGVIGGVFHDSTEDNYTDVSISGASQLVFSSKTSLGVNVGYLDGHEDRGTGASQGQIGNLISGPAEFTDTSAGAAFTYGSPSSQGRLVFSADYLGKSFDDDGAQGALNAGRDRSDVSLSAKFLYALSSDTQATFELKNTSVDYDTSDRDNDELEYFVGMEWQATSKTSGYAKVGFGDKDFDSATEVSGGTELNWDAGVVWEPKSFSSVNVFTSREEEETSGTGSYIDTSVFGVTWTYGFTDQVSTDISYSSRGEEYVGSSQDDNTDSYGVKINYAFDRWLDIGVGYDYSDKSSSVSGLGYDRSKFVVSFDLSL